MREDLDDYEYDDDDERYDPLYDEEDGEDPWGDLDADDD